MATLYIVSTPIGNLGDVTARAAEVLCSVDRILAEDTRRTRVLADHIGASARLVSLHAHNEEQRIDRILAWLDAGEDLALVSDAGTPLVSDPGGRLVAAAADAGHVVVPIPGPSAVLAALVASGLPASRFTFLGFPDRKGRARRDLIERVRDSEETVVLFESPQRAARLLAELAEACGNGRPVAVARELTKMYEEIRRGTLAEVGAYYRDHPPKGEVTVVVGGVGKVGSPGAVQRRTEAARALAHELGQSGMKASEAAHEISRRLDLPRNDAYRIVHETSEIPKEA